VLPTIAGELEVVAFQTATLTDIHAELAQLRLNTAALPNLNIQLARVEQTLDHVELNTQAVQQLANMAQPLHDAAMRIGRFSGRLPQRNTAAPTQRHDRAPHPTP
jgi:uncharacterized protein YceH (UPF0502 family)